MFLNSTQASESSKWFFIQKPKPEAKLRLFCFPYAGGNTSIFRNWHEFLPDFVEVIAIRTPGRENRLNEQPISSLPLLVNEIEKNIQPLLTKPFVFFGHSNGALTCFELARLLQRKKSVMPNGVILSAKSPPHRVNHKKHISQLPDNEFLIELAALKGTPPALLQNQELMELLMPMLRADFALSETFVYQDDIQLSCPAVLLYGSTDTISLEEINAWGDLIQRSPQVREITGGHFFIDEQREQLLKVVEQLLTDIYMSTHQNTLNKFSGVS